MALSLSLSLSLVAGCSRFIAFRIYHRSINLYQDSPLGLGLHSQLQASCLLQRDIPAMAVEFYSGQTEEANGGEGISNGEEGGIKGNYADDICRKRCTFAVYRVCR